MTEKDQQIPQVQPEEIDTEKKAQEAVEVLREAVRFYDYRCSVLNDHIVSAVQYDDFF